MIRGRANSHFAGGMERRHTKAGGVQCTVSLLDGRELQLEINKKTTGQWIFEYIVSTLKLTQQDFFGILYEDEHKFQQWLDLTKSVRKQTKKDAMQLFFSVRYYPIDPTQEDPLIRTQMYWQVKRDFVDGRLPCTPEIATQLSAYIAQAEMCDWLEPREEYLSTLGLHNTEFQSLKEDIVERHKKLKGMTPIDAMTDFIDIASRLEFYGMIFFEVKCEEKMPHILGLSPHGVSLCKEFMITQSYAWNRIVQVSYKGKRFTLKVTGKWASGNSKPSNVHYEVESHRTCRELYFTVIEHINFYKDLVKTRAPLKGPTQIKIPSSISTEMLSQVLLKSIENEEELREKERKINKSHLQRSLSLPRDSIHKLSTAAHTSPLTLMTTPSLDSASRPLNLSSEPRPASSHPLNSDERNGEEEEEVPSGEEDSPSSSRQCLDSADSAENSVHDSLLDLANDLGEGEEEEIQPKHQRSNSNPEVLFCSTKTRSLEGLSGDLPTGCSVSPVGGVASRGEGGGSSQKQKNLLLLQKWMKEQQKKELDDSVTSPQAEDKVLSKTGATSHSTSSSSPPSNSYRLRVNRSSPSPPLLDRSSPYYRPNSATASSSNRIEDLYSIPRPSPAPSPGFLRRPHPFSRHHSAKSDFLLPSRASSSSHNDYDIPRSLLDLRPLSSQGACSMTEAQSESSLIGRTSTSVHSLSSIPGGGESALSQINALRDEYPDYDIPKPHSKYNPDYDIPKPLKKYSVEERGERSGTGDAGNGVNSETCTTSNAMSTDCSFGILDSIMAGIDDTVAAVQQKSTNSASLPSLVESSVEAKYDGPKHYREHSTPIILEGGKGEGEKKAEPVYDHLAAKIALQQLIADGIIKVEKEGGGDTKLTEQEQTDGGAIDSLTVEGNAIAKSETTPPSREVVASLPEVDKMPSTANEKEEKEAGKENHGANTSKAEAPISPPNHLLDLAKGLKLEGGEGEKTTTTASSKNRPPNLPFDPQFFARQTALEKDKTDQLPPDVARFMSWVKTGTVTPPTPPPKPNKPDTMPKPNKSDVASKKDTESSTERKKKKSISPIIKRKVTPPIKEAKPPVTSDGKHKEVKTVKDIKGPEGKAQPLQDIKSPMKEPIYHEIQDKKEEKRKAPPNPVGVEGVGGEGGPVRPNDGALQKQSPGKERRGGGAEKENKVIPPAASHFKKDVSLPLIQTTGIIDESQVPDKFSGKRWNSFNARKPLQIKLAPPPPPNAVGDESIPSSPSFYTSNPQAGTMPTNSSNPSEEEASKHVFKEHLDQMGSNNLPQHHHVVNWVQGTQRFWDDAGGQAGEKVVPPLSRAMSVSRPPLPPPQNRSLSVSHSVHSKLGQQIVRGSPHHGSSGGGNRKDFKDHVYEDPDTLLKSSLLERKATEPALFQQSGGAIASSVQGISSASMPQASLQHIANAPSSLQHQANLQSGLRHQQGGFDGKFFTTGRPRAQTSYPVTRPYVTREHKSSSGNTVYATDV